MAVRFSNATRGNIYLFPPEKLKIKPELNGRHEFPTSNGLFRASPRMASGRRLRSARKARATIRLPSSRRASRAGAHSLKSTSVSSRPSHSRSPASTGKATRLTDSFPTSRKTGCGIAPRRSMTRTISRGCGAGT